jgi:Flp pilus assembly protein TadG
MFALVGIAAFVVDLGNIHVARNELQNAVDAGALAGTRMLYNDTGTEMNCVDDEDSISANAVAQSVATANFSQNKSVEVNWISGTNGVDVQRGHWSFGRTENLAKGFYPNDSCGLTDLWNVSTETLDADTDFINAVRVVARRQATPVASFFARIFGHEGFEVSAEAVGYIGFAGTINPGELDLPLALCENSILVDDKYSCNIGRMINSGNNDATNDTGRWTNFSSAPDENLDVCEKSLDPVDSSDFKDMPICDGEINSFPIFGGDELSTNNGEMDVLSEIYKCFADEEKYNKNTPWEVTLPVIDCNSNSGCAIVKGAVTVTIIWINVAKNYAEAPIAMGGDSIENWGAPLDDAIKVNSGENSLYEFMKTLDDYSGVEDWNKELTKEFGETWSELPLDTFFDVADMALGETKAAGKVRWASFIRHFNLKNVSVTEDNEEVVKPAPYAIKSIYFLPDCSAHELAGRTGGENFGVLAKIPALVH